MEAAADRERAAGVVPGLTLADILREERGEDGAEGARARRGEGSLGGRGDGEIDGEIDGGRGWGTFPRGSSDAGGGGDAGGGEIWNLGTGTGTSGTAVPGGSGVPAVPEVPPPPGSLDATPDDDAPSRGSLPPGSEELFRVARAANRASLAEGAFGVASQTQTQTQTQTHPRARSQSQSQTRPPPPRLRPRPGLGRRDDAPDEGVDRDVVVLSQAEAAASQRATQDDPLYGLLMDFAHHAESSDLRRASIAAAASAEVAREAEEARGLARAFAEDDDDPDDLDAFASATQREWDDLREVQGTAEEEETTGEERRAEEARRAEAKTATEPDPETEPNPETKRETDAPLETARARPIDTSTSKKVCWICGEDCSRERREWSRETGYAHKSCSERRREAEATRALWFARRFFDANDAPGNVVFPRRSPRTRSRRRRKTKRKRKRKRRVRSRPRRLSRLRPRLRPRPPSDDPTPPSPRRRRERAFARRRARRRTGRAERGARVLPQEMRARGGVQPPPAEITARVRARDG